MKPAISGLENLPKGWCSSKRNDKSSIYELQYGISRKIWYAINNLTRVNIIQISLPLATLVYILDISNKEKHEKLHLFSTR